MKFVHLFQVFFFYGLTQANLLNHRYQELNMKQMQEVLEDNLFQNEWLKLSTLWFVQGHLLFELRTWICCVWKLNMKQLHLWQVKMFLSKFLLHQLLLKWKIFQLLQPPWLKTKLWFLFCWLHWNERFCCHFVFCFFLSILSNSSRIFSLLDITLSKLLQWYSKTSDIIIFSMLAKCDWFMSSLLIILSTSQFPLDNPLVLLHMGQAFRSESRRMSQYSCAWSATAGLRYGLGFCGYARCQFPNSSLYTQLGFVVPPPVEAYRPVPNSTFSTGCIQRLSRRK